MGGQCIIIFWCTVEDGMSNKAQFACDFVCPYAATAIPWRGGCTHPMEPACGEVGTDVVDVMFAATLNAKPFFDEMYSLRGISSWSNGHPNLQPSPIART